MAEVRPRRALSAVAIAAASVVLLTTACEDRAPTTNEREALAEPTDQIEPVFHKAFDPSWLVLKSPIRMAATQSGRLLVSDSRWQAIVRIDRRTLLPDQAFETRGKPLAVGMVGGKIFVGNATANTIDVYGSNGSWRSSFGPGAVAYPADLAIDRTLGLLFVVAGGTYEIMVFDLDGVYQRTISGPGLGGDRLQAPTGIALDEGSRQVLVSDYGAPGGYAGVKVFDYDGNFLQEISGKGKCSWFSGCTGGFSRPQGLEVGADGLVYLTDVLLGQVMVLDRETGEAVGTLGGHASDGGTLRRPVDVVFDKKGRLCVLSSGTGTVEAIALEGVTP